MSNLAVLRIMVRDLSSRFSYLSVPGKQARGLSSCWTTINSIVVEVYLMKKILIIAIFLFSLAGPVAAYEISIFAPASLNVGEPIIVNGTTNFPPGTSFDITLSHSDYITEIKDTKSVVIQQGQNFSVVFPTVGYVKGTYKIEVPPISQARYLGNSVPLRVVELIDRSDEVTFSSPLTQYQSGSLIVTGMDKNVGNKGIELQITDPDGTILFGPDYITTTASGAFSKETPINASGNYTVTMEDQQGYIGTYIIMVLPRVTGEVPEVTRYVPAATPGQRHRPSRRQVCPRRGTSRHILR